MPGNPSRRGRAALLVATSSVLSAPLALAGTSGTGSSQEYTISTTGATALASFTTGENNRGPYLVGSSTTTYDFGSGAVPAFQIGATYYSIDTAVGQGYGILNKNTTLGAQDAPLSADRVKYLYHSTGSVNGIRDLVFAQGLLQPTATSFPANVNSGQPLWVNGTRLNSYATSTANGYTLPAAQGGSTASPPTANQQPKPVIAYSDVRAVQAFAVGGAASFDRAPGAAGYGNGRAFRRADGTLQTVNYQALTSVDSLDDTSDATPAGVATLNSRVRNEALAVVPFAIAASPGTGLDSVSESDVRFLQAAGRLTNGANFNFATRDVGSGTRNQGANNVRLDPSFSSGERDRVAIGIIPGSGLTVAGGSAPVGDEQSPERNLDGSAPTGTAGQVAGVNEHRPGVLARYADKTSGGSGVRPIVLSARLGMGVLSVGDVGNRGLQSQVTTSTTPIRVLAVDFDGADNVAGVDQGPVQPKVKDVLDGNYQLWSASQAITVTPDGTTIDTAANGAIKGDLDDQRFNADGSARSGSPAAGIGVHRKFLNNITGSISTGPNATTVATPYDAVLNANFIPPQIMRVTKEFDGGTQTTRTLDAAAQAIYDTQTSTGRLATNLNWARAGDMNGDIAAQRYRIFDVNNQSAIGSPSGDIEIRFTGRTFLAGDLNGDGVRDLGDARSWARALANPDAFVSTQTDVDINGAPLTTSIRGSYLGVPSAVTTPGGNLNAAALQDSTVIATDGTNSVTLGTGRAALLALTDLNGDGNVAVVGNIGKYGSDAADAVVPVSRADARYFLYGAAVDTSAQTTAQARREIGVRTGQLKKNAAIDAFNAELDLLVGTANPAGGNFTQSQIDAIKFNKFDVNNDGVVSRADAILVDRNVGKNYTVLADVLSTYDDLVSAELTDDNVIRANGATSDFGLIRAALGTTKLLDGDANLDGAVNFDDLLKLAANYNTSVDQWSDGDFDLTGTVNFDDLLKLAANYNTSVAGDWALAQTAVPEPTSLAMIGVTGTAMLTRRRRKTK